MIIRRLQLTNFRCHIHKSIDFVHRLHVIRGNNGSGKTSCLEAVNLLFNGSSIAKHCINRKCNTSSIKLSLTNGHIVEWIHNGIRSKVLLNNNPTTHKQIFSLWPVMFVPSHADSIIRSSNRDRWKRFHSNWLYNNRELYPVLVLLKKLHEYRQNFLLKQSNQYLNIIEEKIEKLSNVVTSSRLDYLKKIENQLRSYSEYRNITIDFYRGWPTGSLSHLLRACRYSDTGKTTSTYGHHKSGVALLMDDCTPLSHLLSRGESKRLMHTLYRIQGHLTYSTLGQYVIYLLDDPLAELDYISADILLNKSDSQIITTDLNSDYDYTIQHSITQL